MQEDEYDLYLGNIVHWIWKFKSSFGTWKPLNAAVLISNYAPNAITITHQLLSHIRIVFFHWHQFISSISAQTTKTKEHQKIARYLFWMWEYQRVRVLCRVLCPPTIYNKFIVINVTLFCITFFFININCYINIISVKINKWFKFCHINQINLQKNF